MEREERWELLGTHVHIVESRGRHRHFLPSDHTTFLTADCVISFIITFESSAGSLSISASKRVRRFVASFHSATQWQRWRRRKRRGTYASFMVGRSCLRLDQLLWPLNWSRSMTDFYSSPSMIHDS